MKKLFVPMTLLAFAAACGDGDPMAPAAAPIAVAPPSFDLIGNMVGSVNGIAKVMPLNVGTNGSTTLYVTETNGDGKNGCNLTGQTTLTVSVRSSNTAAATVSPSSITFNGCGDRPAVTVTPVAAGKGPATISLAQISNSTVGSFDFSPATFTVTVAGPTNTAPSVTVEGVAAGAKYVLGYVPTATCSVTDAEDGSRTVNPLLTGTLTGGLGEQTATCSYTDNGGLKVESAKKYTIVAPTTQTIAFTSTAPTTGYVGTTYAVSATGGASGNPVAFGTTSEPAICTVSASTNSTATVSFVGAGTCVVTANQAGDATHAAAQQQTQSVTVATKAAQMIEFTSTPTAPKYLGTYTVSATGGTSGNAVTFAPATPTICTVAPGATANTAIVNFVGVGTCTITADQLGSSSHEAAAQQTQQFEVGKAAQSITFGALAGKTFGDASFSVSASASSQLPVSFGAAAGGKCTVSNGTVSITGAGTCTIVASQAGSALYEAAQEVPQSFTIAKAQATVTLGGLTGHTFDGTAKTATATTIPGGLETVTFSYKQNGAEVSPTDAGSYAVVATLDNANYEGAASGTLVIDKATATIALSNLAQVYTGAARLATATTAPVGLSGVSLTYNGSETAPTDAGSYAVVASIDNKNYRAENATGTLVVDKAQATIALSDLNQTYVGASLAATATTAPAGLSGISITYAGSAAAPTNAGSYAVVAALDNKNYRATDATGTFVIAKAMPVLAWTKPGSITIGTALGGTQLNATASFRGAALQGSFTYAPAAGTVLSYGLAKPLAATFQPADQVNFVTDVAVGTTVDVLFAPASVGGHIFLQPVNLPTEAVSVFRLGSTVPLKFQLYGVNAAGQPVLLSDEVAQTIVGSTVTFTKVSANPLAGTTEAAESLPATGGTTFRYDAAADQFVFNWGTRSATEGTWKIAASLPDGTAVTATVSLKK